MKTIMKLFFTISIFCCCVITNLYAQKTIELHGNAGNLYGNVIGGVSMKIEQDSAGNYISAKGCYDNQKLFGCFNITKPVVTEVFKNSGTYELKFDGYLDLGMDGSGFPKNTKVKYVMYLLITSTAVSGMYVVEKIPAYFDSDQTGILSLSYKK
ncbi:MAG: hypothetical protein HGB12_11840 [Bacteroidetes bacterium]|nr:hypothetical protein [Bacteroidota bacterium]